MQPNVRLGRQAGQIIPSIGNNLSQSLGAGMKIIYSWKSKKLSRRPCSGEFDQGRGDRTKVSYVRESLEFPLLGSESDGQLGVLQTLYQGVS